MAQVTASPMSSPFTSPTHPTISRFTSWAMPSNSMTGRDSTSTSSGPEIRACISPIAKESLFEDTLLNLETLASPVSALATDLGANLGVKDSPELPFSPCQSSLSRHASFKRGLDDSPGMDSPLVRPQKRKLLRHKSAHPRMQTSKSVLPPLTASPVDEMDYSPTMVEDKRDMFAMKPTMLAPKVKKAGLSPMASNWNQRNILNRPMFKKPPQLRRMATVANVNPHQSTGGTPRPAKTHPIPKCELFTPVNSKLKFFNHASPVRDLNAILEAQPLSQKENPVSIPVQALLPHQDSQDTLKRVTTGTLVQLMQGQFSCDGYTILDCRYSYEFNGGHIRGAQHVPSMVQMEQFLKDKNPSNRHVIILHCEFSKQRAPYLAKAIRNLDRKTNMAEYPKLSWPEIYVLEGGYVEFFTQHPTLCEGEYVAMEDPRYSEHQRTERSTLSRVSSFTEMERRARLA